MGQFAARPTTRQQLPLPTRPICTLAIFIASKMMTINERAS
jgi:hypothetical protein